MIVNKKCSAKIGIGSGSPTELYNALLGVSLPDCAVLQEVEEIRSLSGPYYSSAYGTYQKFLVFEWTESEEI